MRIWAGLCVVWRRYGLLGAVMRRLRDLCVDFGFYAFLGDGCGDF